MKPLIVITGPTGSGKSEIAMRVAAKHGGEIICADSRTIYRGMDIGTAKPTARDMKQITHHLVDIVDPDETYTVKDFQSDAKKAIKSIRSRGSLPIMVGGTGLYIDAVVLDYRWPVIKDDDSSEYDQDSIAQLQATLIERNIPLPQNKSNKRHLVSALVRNGKTGHKRDRPDENTFVFSVDTEPDVLKQRLKSRAERIFSSGLIEEALELSNRYGWDSEAMTAIVYRIAKRIIDHEIDEYEAQDIFAKADWQYARRQLTWLRRHDYVRWHKREHIEGAIDKLLMKMC